MAQIVKQPDGNYAVFNSSIDQFILLDATANDVLEFTIKNDVALAVETAMRETPKRIALADSFGSSGMRLTWEKALEKHLEYGGAPLDSEEWITR